MKSKWFRLLALALCVVMVFSMTACDGDGGDKDKDQGGSDKTPSNVINAVEYGIDNTGATDETSKMMEMHKKGAEEGKKIYYPNGTYLFNGLKLDFTSGVEFESQDGVLIRNSKSDTPIVNFDKVSGQLIGLMHNHLELDKSDMYVVSGNLVSPPVSEANVETTVDFLPYFYNDFGLESSAGSDTWFYWSWNHHDAGTICTNCGGAVPKGEDPYNPPACSNCGIPGTQDQYDPSRHPLLGYYRGDEPEVLDWISYWLLEHGMNQSILLGHVNPQTWDDRKNSTYWVNQLLNHTENGKKMKFALQLASSDYGVTDAQIHESWWTDFSNFYCNETYKDRVYTYTKDGKEYAVISLWDEQSMRFGLGERNNQLGEEKVIALYKEVSQYFKENGYDGLCVLARTPCFAGDSPERVAVRADLLANDVLWLAADYPSNALGVGSTYEERVSKFLPLSADRIYCVALGLQTHTPHPSAWNCPGNTPALFKTWIDNVVKNLDENPTRERMVTCYNVSEWHEGGAGLCPTVGAGYGYLEAIRDAIIKK